MPHGSGPSTAWPSPGHPPVAGRSTRTWFTALDRFFERVTRLVDELATVLFILLVLATTFTVVVRDQFGLAYAWLDDVIRFMLIWSVYLGVVRLSVHNDHISMDAFSTRLPAPVRRILNMLIAVAGIILAAYSALLGWNFTSTSARVGELSPSGILPAWVGYLSVPAGFALVALAYVRYLITVGTGAERPTQSGIDGL